MSVCCTALQGAPRHAGHQCDEPVAGCAAEGQGGMGGGPDQAQQSVPALRGQGSRHSNLRQCKSSTPLHN